MGKRLILTSKYHKNVATLVSSYISAQDNALLQILIITYADNKKAIEEIYHIKYDNHRTEKFISQITDDFCQLFSNRVHITSTQTTLLADEELLKFDLVIILGGHAPSCLEKLNEMGLIGSVQSYTGTIWEISAGAKVLCEKFIALSSVGNILEYDGLGLLRDTALLVHRDNGSQAAYNHYYSNVESPPVCIGINNGGVVVVENNIISLMVDSFFIHFKR